MAGCGETKVDRNHTGGFEITAGDSAIAAATAGNTGGFNIYRLKPVDVKSIKVLR